jgi:hypothetical protein
VSVEVGAEFTKLWEAKIGAKKTWKWTVTNETSSTEAKSQTAEFTLGGPSFGYSGPVGVDVYYDTLYKTFMFAFPAQGTPLRASGVVEYQTQGPIRHREVHLRVGGRRYRTYTNQYGEYRFYGNPCRAWKSRSQVSASGRSHPWPIRSRISSWRTRSRPRNSRSDEWGDPVECGGSRLRFPIRAPQA